MKLYYAGMITQKHSTDYDDTQMEQKLYFLVEPIEETTTNNLQSKYEPLKIITIQIQTNNNMNKELLNYIDFTSICEDNNLQTGDLPFHDQVTIQIILQRFIDSNK